MLMTTNEQTCFDRFDSFEWQPCYMLRGLRVFSWNLLWKPWSLTGSCNIVIVWVRGHWVVLIDSLMLSKSDWVFPPMSWWSILGNGIEANQSCHGLSEDFICICIYIYAYM
jgi:hypothetical protein